MRKAIRPAASILRIAFRSRITFRCKIPVQNQGGNSHHHPSEELSPRNPCGIGHAYKTLDGAYQNPGHKNDQVHAFLVSCFNGEVDEGPGKQKIGADIEQNAKPVRVKRVERECPAGRRVRMVNVRIERPERCNGQIGRVARSKCRPASRADQLGLGIVRGHCPEL